MVGWVVGNFDFNENPVVSLDLDLDFGLRLRVCQNNQRRITIIDCTDKFNSAINLKSETVTSLHIISVLQGASFKSTTHFLNDYRCVNKIPAVISSLDHTGLLTNFLYEAVLS